MTKRKKAVTPSTGFLPEGYEIPSRSKQFFKLKEGDNKFRILTPPLLFWEIFVVENGMNKPKRFPFENPPTTEDMESFTIAVNDDGDPAYLKHCWGMFIIDREDGKIKFFNLDKKGIQEEIQAYDQHEDYGSPLEYDLTIIREGTSKTGTSYKTIASPPRALSKRDQALWEQIVEECNPDASRLLIGEYPFENYM